MIYKDILLAADQLLLALGSLVIIYAALQAIYLFGKGLINNALDMNAIRLELGNGIILGLEFMIGADIVESMAKPTYYDIGILAALVLIRTFLSYFLGKELEALKENDARNSVTGKL